MTDDASDKPAAGPGAAEGQAEAQAPSGAKGQAMWGGRFSDKPDELMQAINVSIGFDRRLAAQDIMGSKAHAAMLARQGMLSDADAAAIQEGLSRIAAEIEAGEFPFREEFED